MAGQFISPAGDLERMFVDDYEMIDQYAKTGSLWLWGGNGNGSLGDNTNGNGSTVNSKSSPVQTISGGTNWKQIGVGGSGTFHTACIKTDGTLWLWGFNTSGQLGNNAILSRSSPIQTVSGGTNWKMVACGGFSTAAIKTDGTLWLWGINTLGVLGNNAILSRSSPIQTVSGGTNWKQVSMSQYNCAAIKTDGTLWNWGGNSGGQLGDNTTIETSSPVQTVAGGTNWKQVSSGSSVGGASATAAIKTDGTLWTWGNNLLYGQLGDGTVISKSSPVQTVSAGNNWEQVSMSQSGCAAIKTDGTLWNWGIGDWGSLGDNTTVSKSSPVQTVAGGTNWKQVLRSYPTTLAIKTDGTLWTWGNNEYGQIGDNTIVNKSSPVQTVSAGTNWKMIGGGTATTGQGSLAAIYFYDAGNLYPSA